MNNYQGNLNSEYDARRDVAKGAGSVFLAKLGSVMEIITQPAYTWMFGLATYGLYSVLWSLVNIIENVADLAMTAALQRILPKTDETSARAIVIKGALVLGVIPCFMLAIIICWLSPQIAPLFNVADKDLEQLQLAISLFAWSLPLWATLKIATSALRAFQSFGPEIRLQLLWEQICRFVIALAFWLSGMETLALLLAHLGSLAITSVLALHLLNQHCSLKLAWESRLTRPVLRDLFLSGMSVLPTNILNRIFVDMPAILLNFTLPGATGSSAAGLYVIARKLASIPQLVHSVFSHVVSPVAASSANQERKALQALYTFSIRISLLLALPTAVALIMAADSILSLFVTGSATAWPVLVILTIARGIEAAFGPAPALQQVISRRGFPVINSSIGLIIAIAVLITAFPAYETVGVAIAVAIGQLTVVFLSVLQLSLIENLSPFDGSFLRIILGALTASLLVFAVGILTESLPVYVNGVTVLLCYLIVIWLSARIALPGKDRKALGKTGRKLKLFS